MSPIERMVKYRREAKVFVVLSALALAWNLGHDGWWYALGAAFCTVLVALWVWMWMCASLFAYVARHATKGMEGMFDEEA